MLINWEKERIEEKLSGWELIKEDGWKLILSFLNPLEEHFLYNTDGTSLN